MTRSFNDPRYSMRMVTPQTNLTRTGECGDVTLLALHRVVFRVYQNETVGKASRLRASSVLCGFFY